MAWPKTISVRGVRLEVDSWDEIREAIQELGGESVTIEREVIPKGKDTKPPQDGLDHGDRALLIQFIESGTRGLLTSQIAQAVGKKGKGVRPALERWSRKIGLVTEDGATAFEPIKRFDGRGFQMVDHFRRTASAMLGKT
jgi:hypothetical protein